MFFCPNSEPKVNNTFVIVHAYVYHIYGFLRFNIVVTFFQKVQF